MKVFLTMNSLSISFYIVPYSYSRVAPYSRAVTIYIAIIGNTAPFIVIDTDISFNGI